MRNFLQLNVNSFTNWYPGFPNENGNCVAMSRKAPGWQFAWENVPCSHPELSIFNYFCQYDACDTDNYCE